MSTHNIHFVINEESFREIFINICLLGLSRDVPWDSKTSSN